MTPDPAPVDTSTAPAGAEASVARARLPRKFWVGSVIVGVYMLIAVFAPVIAPHDPNEQDVANRLADPSDDHWVGTDELGRDVMSRLIYATRIDLTVGFLGAFVPFVAGTVIGAAAGYVGRWVDAVVMRVADVVQAFPAYVLILALAFALGPGAGTILIAMTLTLWVVYARLIRDEILRVRALEYVQAARVSGLPHHRVLSRHVVPNSISQPLVYLPVDVMYAVGALAAFSFLGLGIRPPDAEWGAMIQGGQPFLRDLVDERGMSLIFVTHDLPVLRQLADRVATMYAGRIIEVNGAKPLFHRPRHPYTHALMHSAPVIDAPRSGWQASRGDPATRLRSPPGAGLRNAAPTRSTSAARRLTGLWHTPTVASRPAFAISNWMG